VGMTSDKKKPVGYRIHNAVRNLDAAAFCCDVMPDVVQLGFGRRCKTMRHLANCSLLCRQAVPSALLHFSGKVPHGLLSNDTALTPIN